MSSSLSWEKWNAVTSKIVEIASLLNVVDEQDFLQEHMSSASLKECIERGENNLARVQLVLKAMLTDDNVSLYNSLCGHFLNRSEAYKSMYQHLSGIDPDTGCTEKYTQLTALQEVKHLSGQLKYLREKELETNERLDSMKNECNDLRKKLDDWIERESTTFQQLQMSIETVSRAVVRPPLFPNPHSDEMRVKVSKANVSYWQGFTYKLVPFLCDENGEYFVDWDDNEEQWKFGEYGKKTWSKIVGSAASSSSSVNLLACSLLLPRQFNSNGLNDRVVHVWFMMSGTSLHMSVSHSSSPSANVASTTVKCHFHLTIKHNAWTSVTELREIIHCQVVNTSWPTVFKSEPLAFPSFSNQIAPSIRLTLLPPLY